MLRIAIDGACRRNGKPDCVSSGGIYIMHTNEVGKCVSCSTQSVVEYESTNQRGELKALIEALKYIKSSRVKEAQILTDSEYLFNSVTKEWYARWELNGWHTADGGPVKNKDLWEAIYYLIETTPAEIVYYHIKGHLISIGKVTAIKSLEADCTGEALCRQAFKKINESANLPAFIANCDYAQGLSEANNGFRLPQNTFKIFIAMNTVADAVATKAVENAVNAESIEN